jgi:Ca2+-binding EF-hand superfamily protein
MNRKPSFPHVSLLAICRIGAALALLLSGQPFALAQSSPARDARPADATPKTGPEAWDANHDGINTCNEWKSHLDRMFNLGDRNHDGRLDASEFATIRHVDPALADADFGYFDENQDGKITRDEFVSKPSEYILRYDRNGDCRVTPDEVKASAPKDAPTPGEPTRDRWHTN